MAARLKRLKRMVRGMMDVGGNLTPQPGQPELGEQKLGSGETPQFEGQVVRGQNATISYVGATHYMAVLEDVSRNYMWSRGGRVCEADALHGSKISRTTSRTRITRTAILHRMQLMARTCSSSQAELPKIEKTF